MTKADRYARIDRAIKSLEAQKSTLKDDMGEGSHEGVFYVVKISSHQRKKTAWKSIATKLGATVQMITGNTTMTPYTKALISERLQS